MRAPQHLLQARIARYLIICLAIWLTSQHAHALLVELDGIAKITAGGFHTCALTTGGGVKCWGDNYYGQLGNDSTTMRLTPVDVLGLGTGVTAITAGYGHTCALTTAGGVKCWGDNEKGQLGDGSTTERNTPVDVSGLGNGVAAISAGGFHTCAVTNAGGVKCWGVNLTDGHDFPDLTPIDISGLGSGVAAITAGNGWTCVLTTAGGVKCWGAYVQTRDGYLVSYTPVDVTGLGSGVAAIAAGQRHNCALTTTGGVKCWGDNSWGELGDNSTTDRVDPVDVSGLGNGVIAIAAGAGNSCALTAVGAVKCWGAAQAVGDNSLYTDRHTPVDVSGLGSGVAAIAVGGGHACALTTAGTVKCWGYRGNGALGDNSNGFRLTPVDVPGLGSGVVAIGAGGRLRDLQRWRYQVLGSQLRRRARRRLDRPSAHAGQCVGAGERSGGDRGGK